MYVCIWWIQLGIGRDTSKSGFWSTESYTESRSNLKFGIVGKNEKATGKPEQQTKKMLFWDLKVYYFYRAGVRWDGTGSCDSNSV